MTVEFDATRGIRAKAFVASREAIDDATCTGIYTAVFAAIGSVTLDSDVIRKAVSTDAIEVIS